MVGFVSPEELLEPPEELLELPFCPEQELSNKIRIEREIKIWDL